MSRLASTTYALAVLVLVTACSASAPRTAEVERNNVAPPVMITTGIHPELRVPRSSGARVEANIAIEVMIGVDGRPIMSTFKATGNGASENRDALMRWIAGASFKPAQKDGVAVPGLYRMGLQARRR